MTKIAAEKIENVGSNFFGRNFHHRTTRTLPHPIAIIAGPSLSDDNPTEKIENVGWTLSATIVAPPSPIVSVGLSNSIL